MGSSDRWNISELAKRNGKGYRDFEGFADARKLPLKDIDDALELFCGAAISEESRPSVEVFAAVRDITLNFAYESLDESDTNLTVLEIHAIVMVATEMLTTAEFVKASPLLETGAMSATELVNAMTASLEDSQES